MKELNEQEIKYEIDEISKKIENILTKLSQTKEFNTQTPKDETE